MFLSKNKKHSLLDKILMGKFTALPCFLLIIASVLALTFGVLGPIAAGAIEVLCNVLKKKRLPFCKISEQALFCSHLFRKEFLTELVACLPFYRA